jgi:phosphate-selective porin OprO and OprP
MISWRERNARGLASAICLALAVAGRPAIATDSDSTAGIQAEPKAEPAAEVRTETKAETKAETKPATKVDASEGGLKFSSGDNSIVFGAYVQLRGILEDRDLGDADAKGTAGYGTEDPLAPSFDVARLRLSIRGTMFQPWVRYNFSVEAGRTTGEGDNKIKDAYVELGNSRLSVRVGQYKVPFGMQALVPDTAQELVDRSIAVVAFAPDRDTGVMVGGTVRNKTLGYAAGLFNGSGEARRQGNSALLWAARVWFDPLGEYKLSEGAVEAPAKSVLHVGLAVRGGDLPKAGRPGVFEDADGETAVGLELAYKWQAVFITAEAFRQRTDVHNPVSGPAVDSSAWLLQGGYMVVAKRLELAARYSELNSNQDVPGSKVQEARGAVNYYFRQHNLKLQADAARITYGPKAPLRVDATRLPSASGKELTDFQLRVQLQLAF